MLVKQAPRLEVYRKLYKENDNFESLFFDNLSKKDIYIGLYKNELIIAGLISLIILFLATSINWDLLKLYIPIMILLSLIIKDNEHKNILKTLQINFKFAINNKIFIERIERELKDEEESKKSE